VRHHLSRADARRIAVRAQLLDRRRPLDLHEVVRHLAMLQVDPTAAVAPNADLVLWTRLGSAYDPADLRRAIAEHTLIEILAILRPAEDIALLRADMAAWPDRKGEARQWVIANDACRRDILRRLEAGGPLPSRDLPDTCVVPWGSTGWTNNRNITMMLDCMTARGEVAIAGRAGRERLWDLAERVYLDVPTVPAEQARRIRDERRLRSLGIARARTRQSPVEPWDVGEAGEEAVVDGVKGSWRVDPAQLGQPFSGRAALLSPFDRLVHDRARAVELFEFEYLLEMYKPAARRRWGYFALPILYRDRLVGKLDATADRKAGVFTVHALHEDVPFSAAMMTAVDAEIADLARWLGLDLAR
jgi:uncharacterized protein YcaQ